MISNISPNAASAITPFNPLGKQAVGEEEKDSKNSTLKAVEESAQSEKGSLRKDGEENDAIESVLDKEQKQGSNSSKQGSQSLNESTDSSQAGKQNDEAKPSDAEQKEARQEKRQQTQEQEEIRELAIRDREVRNHERAHAAVGGQYAGAPSYQYKKGPDGVNYAVSGEVSINAGTVNNDPQATIAKAQQIRNAALAPADPSPQDRRVAANATQMELQAREELIQERREKSVEKEQQKAAQQEETTKASAPASQQAPSEDDRSDSADSQSSRINDETNRRILALSQNYLTSNSSSSQVGSIVSEAV